MSATKMDEETIARLVREVMNLTSCDEDIAAITLNEFNYDVDRTIGHLLEDNRPYLETVITKKHRNIRKSTPDTQTEKGENNQLRKNDRPALPNRLSDVATSKGHKSVSEENEKEIISHEPPRYNGVKKSRKVPIVRDHINGDDGRERGSDMEPVTNGNREGGSYQKPRYRNETSNNVGHNKMDSHSHVDGEPFPHRRSNRGMYNGGRVFQRREQHPREDFKKQNTVAETPVTPNEPTPNECHQQVVKEDETFAWSGEPLVFTNSATAAQTVDQLMDANDVNLHTILSQYTARPPEQDSETSQAPSKNDDVVTISEAKEEQQKPQEKFNWDDDDWDTPQTKSGVESSTAISGAASTNATTEDLEDNVSHQPSQESTAPTTKSETCTTSVDPEDPETLRKHIFHINKRSKPPPRNPRIHERPLVFSANRLMDLDICATDFRFGDDELRNMVLEKFSSMSIAHPGSEHDVPLLAPVAAVNTTSMDKDVSKQYPVLEETSRTKNEVVEVATLTTVPDAIATDSSSKISQPTPTSVEISRGSPNRHDGAISDNTMPPRPQQVLPSHSGRGPYSLSNPPPISYSDSVPVTQNRTLSNENGFVSTLPSVGVPQPQISGQNIPPIDANVLLHAIQSGLLASPVVLALLQNHYMSNMSIGTSSSENAQVTMSNVGCPPAVSAGLSHLANLIPPAVTASTYLNTPTTTTAHLNNGNVVNIVPQQYILPPNQQHGSNVGVDLSLSNHEGGGYYPAQFYMSHQQQSQSSLMMSMPNAPPHGGQQTSTQMYVQHHLQNNVNTASNTDLSTSQQQVDESHPSSASVHQRNVVSEKFSALSHVFNGSVKASQAHMNETSSSANHVSQYSMNSIPATKAPQQATVVISPVLHAHPAQLHAAHNSSNLYAQSNLGPCGGVDYHSQSSQVASQTPHHLLMSAPSSVTTNNASYHSYMTGQSMIPGHYFNSDQGRLNSTAVPSSLQATAARNTKIPPHHPQHQVSSVPAAARGSMGLVPPHGYAHHWSTGGTANGST